MPANETALVNQIRAALLQAHPGSYICKIHGGAYQMPGIPDLLMSVEGYFIGLEVKHQKVGESEQRARKRATKLQLQHIAKIKAAGGHAAVVLSVNEALKEVAQWLQSKN